MKRQRDWLVEKWTEGLAADNTQGVQLCIQAEKLLLKKKEWTAATLYERALSAQLPAYLSAYAKYKLGHCYLKQDICTQMKAAHSFALQAFIADFPQSRAALNLFSDMAAASMVYEETHSASR